MGRPEEGAAPIPGDPAADLRWLSAAIELSRRCPPSAAAFSVGAIIVSSTGHVVATGYSREVELEDHAEEVALARADRAVSDAANLATGASVADPADRRADELPGATLYSSLEPCLARASRAVSCAELIVASGVGRVVIAWREPPVFKPGGGSAWLADQGVTVLEIPELATAVQDVNRHLLSS